MNGFDTSFGIKRERSFTMLFVDGWFSVNVDTLICEIEKQKNGSMKANSVADKDSSNVTTIDKSKAQLRKKPGSSFQYYIESHYLKRTKHKNK